MASRRTKIIWIIMAVLAIAAAAIIVSVLFKSPRSWEHKRKMMVNKYSRMLVSQDVEKRREAVISLGGVGDKSVIPQLLKALKDEDDQVRENALVSIRVWGDESHLDHVAALLKDKNERVRATAIFTLATG